MAEKGFRIAKDSTKSGWESTDFPVLCETCLGDNPYVRMTREAFGGACHVCERPHAKYRWKAGSAGRFKNTVLCQMCSKLRNVCQCCMLDLTYGVPTEVRDSIISKYQPHMAASLQSTAISDVNRSYALMTAEAKQASEGGIVPFTGLAATIPAAHAELMALGRNKPHYERNAPKLCTFFARGECTRGIECPYRHELPSNTDKPFSRQNYKDRYYGVEDPVAQKMLGKSNGEIKGGDTENLWDDLMARNPDAVSLWVGNIMPACGVTEADLRAAFSPYGEVRHITMSMKASCAFVDMSDHEQALAALRGLGAALPLKGVVLRLSWARPRGGLDTRNLIGGDGAERAAARAATAPIPESMMAGSASAPAAAAPAMAGGTPADAAAAYSMWMAYQGQMMAAMQAAASGMMMPGAPPIVGASTGGPGSGGGGPVKGGKGATARAREETYPSMNPYRMGAVPKHT